MGAGLPPNTCPAMPLVIVTASGRPSEMAANVEAMDASRGETPRGTAWSRATVTVRPSRPNRRRSRISRPRPAVVPVVLREYAVLVLMVILPGCGRRRAAPWSRWEGREGEGTGGASGPGVDAHPHVLARGRELDGFARAVEGELGADEVGDLEPAVGDEGRDGVETVEAAGRGGDDLPLVVVDVVGHDRQLGARGEAGDDRYAGPGSQRRGVGRERVRPADRQ